MIVNRVVTIDRYNRIRSCSSPVEFDLIREEIDDIDLLIDQGQQNYNWNSLGTNENTKCTENEISSNHIDELSIVIEVPEYIEALLRSVKKLHTRVFRAQENVARLKKLIYSWAMMPVLDRKDLKDENLLALGEREERFEKRFADITASTAEIDRVLEENYCLFFDLLPESEYSKDDFELEEGTLHRNVNHDGSFSKNLL